MKKEELELIQKAQKGNTRAFDELVRIHDRRVLQIGFNMLGNMQDAQDVYQEAFIKAYTKISSFRFESEFSTWLNKITMNMAVNRYRQRKLRNWLSIEQKKENFENWDLPEKSSDILQPDQSVTSDELMKNIHKSLEKLSPQQRSVFVMKHLHGYKISEIAETLNVAEGTIKNQLFRATRKLREALKPIYRENLSV